MTLRLSEVHIKNYKSCIDTHLNLSDFTVLIGYNNAGKSNCLSALEWLLRKKVLMENHFNDTTQPLEIEGLIEGIETEHLDALGAKHKNSITPFICNGSLKIKRQQPVPGCKVSDIKLEVWNNETSTWVSNPTGIDNAINSLFPEPIRINAMENAADDATKAKTTSTIGKLLGKLTESIQQQHKVKIAAHLGRVSEYLSSTGTRRLPALNDIDKNVNSKVQDFFPGIGIKLHFESPTFEELFKAGTLKVLEEGQPERDFTSYGHGSQRSIQMALIRYLAEITKETSASTTLLLIDEPELYLHPFAIEQLREALLMLSSHGYQIIISTHSAQMVTAKLAENALLIRKDGSNGTHARTRLIDATTNAIKDYPSQAQLLFSLTYSSQILFAEKVLLAEGQTESRLIPFLFQQFHQKTLGQQQYALIALGGVDSTGKAFKVLEQMQIPTKAICDLDYAFNGAIAHKFIDKSDENFINCLAAIQKKANSYDISLENGKPIRDRNKITSRLLPEIYEILAADADIQPHIEKLHQHLKTHNIWLWRKGAIEVPLGLKNKDEKEHARFQNEVNQDGLSVACKDYDEVTQLMEWIVQD